MLPFTSGDETLALNVANIALGAVTLGLLTYFLAALIYGLFATRRKHASQWQHPGVNPKTALGRT